MWLPGLILSLFADEEVKNALLVVGVAGLFFFAGSYASVRFYRRALSPLKRFRLRGVGRQLKSIPTHNSAGDGTADDLLEYEYDTQESKQTQLHQGGAFCPLQPPHRNGDTEEQVLARRERAQILLTLALQSYQRPADGAGYLTPNIRGLPTVTFFDRQLVGKIFHGALHVNVHCANNLPPHNSFGYYVEVFASSNSFRTRTDQTKTRNPKWTNEDHWLLIKDPHCEALCVRMMGEDQGPLHSDEDMGVAVLGLAKVAAMPCRPHSFKLPLRGVLGDSTVTISCTFHWLQPTTPPPDSRSPSQTPAEKEAPERMVQSIAAQTASQTPLTSPSERHQMSAPEEITGAAAEDAGDAARRATPQLSRNGDGQRGEQGSEHVLSTLDDVFEALRRAPKIGDNSPSAMPARIQSLGDGDLKPVAYIDCSSTDTQAWIFRDSCNKRLVVAFRGTEVSQVKDILTDARIGNCTFITIAEGLRTLATDTTSSSDGSGNPREGQNAKPNNVMVHSGFMAAYKSVRSRLVALVYAIITHEYGSSCSDGGAEAEIPQLWPEKKPWEIMFTGHSLGGALATLAAYELGIYRGSLSSLISDISVYTYGSPRVGNAAFAADFNSLVPDTWRFTNKYDIVTSVPFTLPLNIIACNYSHVGNPVRLLRNGLMLGLERKRPLTRNDLEGLDTTTRASKIVGQRVEQKCIQGDVTLWWAALHFWRCTKDHKGVAYKNMVLADPVEYTLQPQPSSFWHRFIVWIEAATYSGDSSGASAVIRNLLSLGRRTSMRTTTSEVSQPLLGPVQSNEEP